MDNSAATAPMAVDGVAAAARVTPASAEELAATLREANERGDAVTPVGGGTQLDIGMPPSRVDVIVDTTGLDKIVEYEPADLTVTLEAGMRFGDLQRLLAENAQFLALDPPDPGGATVGGLIATNSSGPLRFAYGTARDLVIGTRVANADGALTRAGGRVVKNVAGYDLNKLYIGSLGTLGVVVELSFKLAPLPPATATIVGEFGDLNGAHDSAGAAVHSPLSPLAIELIGPGAAEAASLPPTYTLVFRVGGYPQAVQRQVRDLSALLRAHGGRVVEHVDTAWEDLARMRLDAQQREVVLKAAAPIAASSTLVDLLERHLVQLQPIVWAHAGSGVAFAACDASSDVSLLLELRREVGRLGENASVVIQRCPTVLKRSIDVWGEPGQSMALMRAIKHKLDPKGTLNPGRYVGGI
jgi:glycolate oxidase FAD binding subunit